MAKISRNLLKSTVVIFLGIFIFASLLWIVSPAKAEPEGSSDIPVLVVGAQGTVTAAPDQARISLAVITFDKDLSKAQKTNNINTQRVIDALLRTGIEEDDMETANYTVYPQYNYGEKGEDLPEITGYRVRNEISVVVKKIENLGTVLNVAVEAGANNVNYINFEKSDMSVLEDKALAEAVFRAQSKARIIAEAAGVKLGRILTINAGGIYTTPPVILRSAAESKSTGMGVSDQVPIQPGQIKTTASITITYEILMPPVDK